MSESRHLGVESIAEKIRVFVSFDREHDEDLHDLITEQASKLTFGFEISARSRARASVDFYDEELRRTIREADEVIVICGEHTDCSERVGTELRIAQEEQRPYFLLWGRRGLMWAKPADSMYSWTWEILQNQIIAIHRTARTNENLAALSRVKATPKSQTQEPY